MQTIFHFLWFDMTELDIVELRRAHAG